MLTNNLWRTVLPSAFLLALFGCSGNQQAASLGIQNGRFSACPSTPNCVSSDAADVSHKIAPFKLKASPETAWQQLQQQLTATPRCQIVKESADYLHAECRSAVFRFVDDLEFQLRPAEQIIAVRSAARVGYSDFGVNRKRLEKIRAELIKAGAVR